MAGLGLGFSFTPGLQKEAAADSAVRDKYFAEEVAAKKPEKWSTIEGYRIIMSTDDAAVIEYYATVDQNEATIRVNLTWDDSANDWRLDLVAGPPEISKTIDRTVFTRWR